uniref:Uncharacterized protein n=1 Tax=Hyaloperonospora arabidopsidis (strain Emoy2) TaxID=559515 RepID=M4BC03_HYAAE
MQLVLQSIGLFGTLATTTRKCLHKHFFLMPGCTACTEWRCVEFSHAAAKASRFAHQRDTFMKFADEEAALEHSGN